MKVKMLITDGDAKVGDIVDVSKSQGSEMIEHKWAELAEEPTKEKLIDKIVEKQEEQESEELTKRTSISTHEPFWLPLTDDKSVIIHVIKEDKKYRVTVIESDGNEQNIKWQDTQRTPFWKKESLRKQTWKAIKRAIPDVSEEKLKEATCGIANADNDGNIPKRKREDAKEYYLEEDQITDKAITDTIMADNVFYCDINDPNLTLYIWNDGKWHNGTAAGTIIHELSEIFKNEDIRSGMVVERTTNFIVGQAMNTLIVPKPSNLVSFKNGLLDIDTMTMRPHDCGIFCVNQIPHDYDPTAKCPKWLKFVSEVTLEGDRDFLQEWAGYHLVTDYPEPAFAILTGTGQNGKDVWMKVLTKVLGEENMSSETLADLTYDIFKMAELYHRLGNMGAEIARTTINNAAKVKELSGDSMISAQKKFGQPFQFRNYAKMTFACNEPPEIRDSSDAVRFRLKFVKFPYTFSKKPKEGELQAVDKKKLVADLLTETPGIINWMLEGLKRFWDKEGQFSPTQSGEEQWKEYQRMSNPVLSFMEEMLKMTGDDDNKLTIDQMYDGLKTWLKDCGIKLKLTREKMIKQLKAEGIETERRRIDDQKRLYYGVKIEGVTGVTSESLSLYNSEKNKNTQKIEEEKREDNKNILGYIGQEINRHTRHGEAQDMGAVEPPLLIPTVLGIIVNNLDSTGMISEDEVVRLAIAEGILEHTTREIIKIEIEKGHLFSPSKGFVQLNVSRVEEGVK